MANSPALTKNRFNERLNRNEYDLKLTKIVESRQDYTYPTEKALGVQIV